MICWRHWNRDLNRNWKTLSNTFYTRISSMDYEGKVSKKLKSIFFVSLNTLCKLFFDNDILKTTKLWTNEESLRLLGPCLAKLYASQNTKKSEFYQKVAENRQNNAFFVFCDVCNLSREGRKKRSNPSFCSEFSAL